MHATTMLSLTQLAAAIRQVTHGLGWGALLAIPGFAVAGPTGDQLVQGSAAVARPDALTTRVTQASENAVLNWQSFSVAGEEYVQFIQPGTQSAILNRVVGGHESEILGRMEANGRVFLVNPQGVYFGPGARVDTAGFAASALDIDNADFMAGRYVFSKGAQPTGRVINDGHIHADEFVVLMGDRVENGGLIEARLGTVVLAAGSATTLQLDESGLVSFSIDKKTVAEMAGVENSGQIIADGGRVLMSAKVADDLVATAVNNSGLVRAHSVEEADGQIYLRAVGGNVTHSGVLDVAGEQGQSGGRAMIRSDQDVMLEAGSRIDATGSGAGTGGVVRLIADQKLTVREEALVDVQGGPSAVKGGGKLELSGHVTMDVQGETRIGAGGRLLIDPARLRLDNNSSGPGNGGSGFTTVGKGFIEGALNAGVGVTLVASDEIFASRSMEISAFGSGDLALKIGTIAIASFSSSASPSFGFSGSLGGADGLSSCINEGVCFDTGSSGQFFPDASGDIHLAGVNFNLNGELHVQVGTQFGSADLGNVFASRIVINDQISPASSVVTGNLFAHNDGFAQVLVRGGIVTTGDVSAVNFGFNNADANVSISSTFLTVQGDLFAGAFNQDSAGQVFGGQATIDLTTAASGSILVLGQTTAIGLAGANLDIVGNFFGSSGAEAPSVTLQGFVNVNGGGFASFRALTGGSGGNFQLAEGALVHSLGSDASVFMEVAGGLQILGPNGANGAGLHVQTDRPGTEALVLLAAQGAVDLSTEIFAEGQAVGRVGVVSGKQIFVNSLVHAAGDISVVNVGIVDPGILGLPGGAGGNIFGDGLIQADIVGLGWDPGGAAEGGALTSPVSISVRTDAQNIFAGLFNSNLFASFGVPLTSDIAFGNGALDLFVDNTVHAGPTNLIVQNGTFLVDPNNIGPGADRYLGFGTRYEILNDDLNLGAVRLNMNGDTTVSGAFSAKNLAVNVANGALRFADQVTVGEFPLPPEFGDPVLLNTLSQVDKFDGTAQSIPRFDGVTSVGPNAVFRARNGLAFDKGMHFTDPDVPYVIFQTDGALSFGPGITAGPHEDFFAQFTTFDPTRDIVIENSPANGPGNFFNELHFKLLPGTTVLLGSESLQSGPQAGSIVVGDGIDIGEQNIAFATRGFSKISPTFKSTGFVRQLRLVAGVPTLIDSSVAAVERALEEEFEVPTVTEFNLDSTKDEDQEDEEDEYVEVDGAGAAESDELVSQQSNTGQMCE